MRNTNAEQPLEIYVGRQSDGHVYQLHPRSERRIREAFPDARILPGMMVDYGTRRDFEEWQAPYCVQVATMLTGLTREQLEEMGGIRIYDPREKKALWELTPTAAGAR